MASYVLTCRKNPNKQIFKVFCFWYNGEHFWPESKTLSPIWGKKDFRFYKHTKEKMDKISSTLNSSCFGGHIISAL
jgi:hypothetical protein